MAEDLETALQFNPCCETWKNKYVKVTKRCSKLEAFRKTFLDTLNAIEDKYNRTEKENGNLKQAMGELELQVSRWKDEKEKECAIRVDLEDEVSALKEENELFKKNGNSASQEGDGQLQERLNDAEKEIDRLKELLVKEKARADSEKKKAETERKKAETEKKKANSALKEIEKEKKKANEAQGIANVEKKKSEENKLLLEKLEKGTAELKSILASERSKSEAAGKKLEAEKQKTIRERKRADSAVAKAEEQRKLAELYLTKAEDAKQLEEKLKIENEALKSMLTSERSKSEEAVKKLEIERQKIAKEKKQADLAVVNAKEQHSGTKKAKKQMKIAEEQKKIAKDEKHRADQLCKEVEVYKQRLKESQKELEELVSYKTSADNTLRYNNISETDSVKLLKEQLKLEKMLVKHAKKATKLEVIRNNMLHQELFHLKQECRQFQQRLDMLDNSFFSGGEGTNELEKMGDPTFTRKTLYSDGSPRQLTSGISSRLSPPCRGSKQKILQSSAINSSSASFSDQSLGGSQERGTFSVMSSANLGEDLSSLKPTVPRLFNKVRMKDNGKAIPENSVASPIRGNANGRMGRCTEKKRIIAVVESVENLCFKGQRLHQQVSEKLSQLQGVLNGQKADPAEDNQPEYYCEKDVRPSKRRKTSCDRAIVLHPSVESGEPKSGIDDSDASMQASPPDVVAIKFDNHLEGGLGNTLGSSRCIPQDFEDIQIYDYMKLLELDNEADEESYRRAMAEPLSPTLPEIEFHRVEAIEVDSSQRLVDKSSVEVSSRKDNLGPSSSFHSIEADLVLNGVVSPELRIEEDSVQLLTDGDVLQVNEAHFHPVQLSGERFGISDTSCPGNEGISKSSDSVIAPGDLLKYFVIFSKNKDSNSISRILETISSCMPRSSLNHSTDFLQDLLVTLKNAQNLCAKERASVFFSISLYQISEVGMRNLTNVLSDNSVRSLGSLSRCICSALTDLALRRIFMESCDLSELLSLIEDFLRQKKVLMYADVYSDLPVLCNPKVNVVLNGNPVGLSEQAASSDLLVAGASLLASLCSATDYIGFVCETSWNILMTKNFDSATMLAVLHAFAHACGSKYFTLQEYSVSTTVLKSLVMLLEKQTISVNPSTYSSSQGDNMSKNWSCCTNCPFTEGAVSVNDVASLLLEKLQKYGQSASRPWDLFLLVNSPIPRVWSSDERIEEVSGLREGVDSFGDKFDENLCGFTDILSSVEILASFMGWDWTRDIVVDQLCELVDSCLTEGFSAAIVILLGQLGRLGVDASGYEDTVIKKLRGRLSSFLCERIFSKLSLPVQFAIMTAVFSISPIKIGEIVENKIGTPVDTSQVIPVKFVRKWFSLLSHEQKSFFRLHQAEV